MSTFSARIFTTATIFTIVTIIYGLVIGLERSDILTRAYFMDAALISFWILNRKEFSR